MGKSRLYSFIDNKHGFTVHFIEGHQLISDLERIHNIGPVALPFYQKTVLSSQMMINFLKPGENLGFYIDSETPYFRFKIEMAHNGSLRTLLLPEEFSQFDNQFSGKVRIHKIFPSAAPYTSLLEMEDHEIGNLVNEVMDKSYQTNSKVFVRENSSASFMITKLPPTNINKKVADFEETSFVSYQKDMEKLMDIAFAMGESEVDQVVEAFEKFGLNYLSSKEVKFHCPCSHERMVKNIFSLKESDRRDLFVEQDSIETRCDYCNTIYEIKKEEIITELQ